MSAAADEEHLAPARVSVVAVIGYTAFLAGPLLVGLLGDRTGVLQALLVVHAPAGARARPRPGRPATALITRDPASRTARSRRSSGQFAGGGWAAARPSTVRRPCAAPSGTAGSRVWWTMSTSRRSIALSSTIRSTRCGKSARYTRADVVGVGRLSGVCDPLGRAREGHLAKARQYRQAVLGFDAAGGDPVRVAAQEHVGEVRAVVDVRRRRPGRRAGGRWR